MSSRHLPYTPLSFNVRTLPVLQLVCPHQPAAVSEFETSGKKKKKKGSSSSSKKKKSPAEAAPEDKKAIARAAAAKNKKANEKKAAAAEKKKKTALSLPDEDGEEIDLVARMEEARRAMPNACVVRRTRRRCVVRVGAGGVVVCRTCRGRFWGYDSLWERRP